MKLLYLNLLIILNCTFAFYKMGIKKCKYNDDFSIDYFRYQYDHKHYPQFCDYKNNNFDLKSIDYMRYTLDRYWYTCENDYTNTNVSEYEKNILLWKDNWYDFGSCSKFNQYEYFNVSLILYYNFQKSFKNCYYNDHYCDQVFDDDLKPLKYNNYVNLPKIGYQML